MLLSPYKNPPFRLPISTSQAMSTTTTPPPHQNNDPSPKRKRTNSTADLRINTTASVEEADSPGQNSPRSKVAEKLRELDLRQSPKANRQKRLKLDAPSSPSKTSKALPSDPIVQETPQQTSLGGEATGSDGDEIAETPNCYLPRSSSPTTPRKRAPHPLPIDFTSIVIPRRETKTTVTEQRAVVSPPPKAARIRSPPPPHSSSRTSSLPQTGDGDLIFPDRASLTWQDSEITGHELDLVAGDDGLGINGIGFRPTPAMAYARQQRRRQQVSEWKAREAREARQRRMEKRRGTGGQRICGESGGGGRVVRFVEG